MIKEKVLGIVRHVLTYGGGFLTAQGVASQGELETIIAGVIAIVGAVWSWLSKEKKA